MKTLRGKNATCCIALLFGPVVGQEPIQPSVQLRVEGADLQVPQRRDEPVRGLSFIGSVDSLAWSPDGSILAVQTKPSEATMSGSYAVWLWEVRTGRLRRVVATGSDPIFSVAFSPDNHSLACGVWPGLEGAGTSPVDVSLAGAPQVLRWDVATGKPLEGLVGSPTDDLRIPFSSDLLNVAYSPDGRTIAACGKLTSAGDFAGQHIGGEVCLWDLASGRLKWYDRSIHTDIVYSIAFSPDGRILASGGRDKLIRLWDAQTGKLVKTLYGVGWSGVSSLAISPDGKLVATGGSGDGFEESGTLRLWNIESGGLMHSFVGFPKGSTVRVAFHPRGKSLLAVGRAEDSKSPAWQVRFLDVVTGELRCSLTSRPGFARTVGISPDGGSLAVGTSEGLLLLYDLGDELDGEGR